MSDAKQMTANATAGGCNPILTLGGRVRQRTMLIVLVAAVLAAGLFFGWDSLAALGLTSVIVSLLPCLLMCAAGICASRMGRKDSGGKPGAAPKDAEETPR